MSASLNSGVYERLQEMELIDAHVLAEAFSQAEETSTFLGTYLLQNELISENTLGYIVGDVFHLPYVNLREVAIDTTAMRRLPRQVATAQQALVFAENADTLHLACAHIESEELALFLERKTGKTVKVFFTFLGPLQQSFALYEENISEVFTDMLSMYAEEASGENSDPPVIKIVDLIFQHAYAKNASDIHIEPKDDGTTLLRFRVDGIMHDVVELPAFLTPLIVMRIKIMAQLRTDEHQEAQDGKISYEVDSEALDIRVSIVPVLNGEKVVLRLLSERSRKFSLRDLGLSEAGLQKVQAAYTNPHGMILATGPTGSGKTTTLYSVLKELNSRSVNIMTIEDPVEYEIENVNQMQVTHTGDVTFASGLRSIVRQDPNIILVGEIRDEETADIAINAAMTGHLVLSTLHTNDAVTAFPRLIDMGVEPYLVSSTVSVVIAQRLLRKICTSCRVSRTAQSEELQMLDLRYAQLLQGRNMYVGKGCAVCGNSGYRGRVGVFEVLVMNDDLRSAIADKHDASYLHTLAVKSGMKTMMQDGVEKVGQGITSLEEVIRVLHD